MTAPLPAQAISPATTRIMVALTAEHDRTGRATVRSVALRAGRSLGVAHYHLAILRQHGLAIWEPGTHGTLRPTVRTLNPTSSRTR